MSDKPTVEITIAGRPKSGKSTIISAVAHHLQSLGIEVDVKWGLDGDPTSHKDHALRAKKLQSMSGRTKVVITEQQLPRKKSEVGDV